MKQAPGSKNCLAVVACMITMSSMGEFESFCGKCPSDGYRDSDMARYLSHKGYCMGGGIHKIPNPIKEPEVTFFEMEQRIWGHPAYVAVKSLNIIGKSHAIYWDGEKVRDPSPHIEGDGLELEAYEILSWWPVFKWEEERG